MMKLYQVVPPSELAGTPEQFFVSVHGLLRSSWARLRHGQPHVAFELGGSAKTVRFYLGVDDEQQSLVFSLFRSAFPGVELRPISVDPLAHPQHGFEAVTFLKLRRSSLYPINTESHEGDPLAPLLAILARVRERHRIHLSILVRPRSNAWHGPAREQSNRLRNGFSGAFAEVFADPNKRRRASAHQVELAKLIEAKSHGLGFDCSIRVSAVARDKEQAQHFLNSIAAGLRPFSGANSFAFGRVIFRERFLRALRSREFDGVPSFILTTEELATLWHLPGAELPHVETIRSAKLPVPTGVPTRGRVVGMSNYPGEPERFVAISAADSMRHLHVLGPTGTGKTTLLLNLAMQDIAHGRGVGVIDPKGDLVDGILKRIPRDRIGDVVLIAPASPHRPEPAGAVETSLGLNPLEWSDLHERDLIADNVTAIFHRIYSQYWGPRTQDVLRSSLLTLLHEPGTTLCHIPALLTNTAYRRRLVSKIDDPIGLGSFWQWYEDVSEAQRMAAIGPFMNKLRDFVSRAPIRRLLGQPRSTFDLRRVVDQGGIFLADLSAGLWGEDTSQLLGSFLFARFWQAIRARAGMPEDKRRNFFLFVDEFQSFLPVASAFSETLAQARSFRLSLTLANQHMGQLPKQMQEALASNTRSRVVFQLGYDDARTLAPEFMPLDAQSLQHLAKFEMALRLSAHGETVGPFTARTIPAMPPDDPGIAEYVAAESSRRYGRPVDEIDRDLVSIFYPDGRGDEPPVPPEDVGARLR